MAESHAPTWLVPEPVSTDTARAVARANQVGHPLVAAVLLHRGLVGDGLSAYLRPDPTSLLEPSGLRNMAAAVRVLDEAIRTGKTIGIAGDYDTDGVTATALLASYLRAKGAPVVTHIPNRNEGYGLSRSTIDALVDEQGARLLITVDCGTSSRAEIDYARTKGVEVIVTDHHVAVPGKEAAGIVVNPHCAGDTYENKGLAGVAVAYKLVSAHYGKQPTANLDLVTLGTVADVMPLSGENRVIVWQGLGVLSHTKRVGLDALLRLAVKPKPCPHGSRTCLICPDSMTCAAQHDGVPHCHAVSAEEVAFYIAPRINAVSRMEMDPNLVVELLTTTDAARGREIAALLDDANKSRRDLTNRLVDEAIAAVNPADPVIVLQMDLFKGVAGLVAGRLATTFGRPAIVLDQHGGGSARSIEGVDLLGIVQAEFATMATVAGHAMAMGVSHVTDPDALREGLRAYPWPAGVGVTDLAVDAVCDLADLDHPLVNALERLEPTGAGNRAPILAVGGVRVEAAKTSKDGRHAFLTVSDGSVHRRAVWFGGGPLLPAVGALIDVAGRPARSIDFDRNVRIEIFVSAIRPTTVQMALTLG